MYANETQDLFRHSKLVSLVGKYYSKQLGVDNNLEKCVEYSCLLHDSGKAISTFQKHLSEKFEEKDLLIIDDCKNDFDGPYHHEISWMVCKMYQNDLFEFSLNKNDYIKIILNSIYWHHGKPIDVDFNFRDKLKDIKNKIDDCDINLVKNFISNLLNVSIRNELDVDDVSVPDFFENVDRNYINSKILTVRSILISADRFVSSLNKEQFEDLVENFDEHIKTYTENNFNPIKYFCPISYDKDRFNTQEECALDSLKYKTVISKSPAGFGKTLQGVLRNLNSGGKVYWVCPRNAVATSVYKSILQELNNLNINISVELFLTGERKDSINSTKEECSSRIVVTNFDNILNPFYKNNHANKSFDMLNSDMIFDEFHEIVSDEAIFSMFCILMCSRNIHQNNSKTFLLSATPMTMDYIWNAQEKTKNLPSNTTHFKSFHNKKYKINFVEKINMLPLDLERSLYKYNSIKNTQDAYQNGHICFHSNFSDKDFQSRFDLLYEYFGKNSDKSYKQNVFSAPIIGASFDISFENAVIMPESPESDIQTIGRINRWGREESANIYMTIDSDRSNKKAIDCRYDSDLTNLWYKNLKSTFQNKEFDLDELYIFYNKFNNDNSVLLRNYLDSKRNESLEKLSKYYYPIKYPKDSKFEKTNGKSLRNVGGQYNIVVRENKVWMNEFFSLECRDFNELLEEEINLYDPKKLKNLLENTLDKIPEFDYTSIKRRLRSRTKRFTKEEIKLFSKNPMTPYPIKSWTYNNKTGLQKN